MSDSQEDKKGGVIWEGNTAWADVQSARAAGDTEAEGLAMRRWSEAQTNASLALVGQVIKPLADQIAGLRLHLDNSDRARLARNTQFQIELQERLDGHAQILDTEVQRLAASVEGAAQLAGKAYALAETVAAGQAELVSRVSDQGERIDTMDQRLVMVEVTPGTYPDLLRGMEHLEKMVIETGTRSDRRQMYLLIAIGSIILLFVVLVALQIANS